MGRTIEDVMTFSIPRGLRREEGQGLVEYALIILFVAVVLVAALTTFGGTLSGLYQQVVNTFG